MSFFTGNIQNLCNCLSAVCLLKFGYCFQLFLIPLSFLFCNLIKLFFLFSIKDRIIHCDHLPYTMNLYIKIFSY